jgi:hypothetical protein
MNLDRPLRSNAHRHLLEACADGQINLCVPELVLDETVNLWREAAESQEERWRASGLRLVDMGLLSQDDIDKELDPLDTAAKKRDELERELAEVGASIPPLPDVDHRKVVERALSRTQPFDREGRHGYRDVLLWETVLELLDDGNEVLLVSADVKAFSRQHCEKRAQSRTHGGGSGALRQTRDGPSGRDGSAS